MKYSILVALLCFANLFSRTEEPKSQQPGDAVVESFVVTKQNCQDEFYEMVQATGVLVALSEDIQDCRPVINDKSLRNPYNEDPRKILDERMEKYAQIHQNYLLTKKNVEQCLQRNFLSSKHQETMQKYDTQVTQAKP